MFRALGLRPQGEQLLRQRNRLIPAICHHCALDGFVYFLRPAGLIARQDALRRGALRLASLLFVILGRLGWRPWPRRDNHGNETKRDRTEAARSADISATKHDLFPSRSIAAVSLCRPRLASSRDVHFFGPTTGNANACTASTPGRFTT